MRVPASKCASARRTRRSRFARPCERVVSDCWRCRVHVVRPVMSSGWCGDHVFAAQREISLRSVKVTGASVPISGDNSSKPPPTDGNHCCGHRSGQTAAASPGLVGSSQVTARELRPRRTLMLSASRRVGPENAGHEAVSQHNLTHNMNSSLCGAPHNQVGRVGAAPEPAATRRPLREVEAAAADRGL